MKYQIFKHNITSAITYQVVIAVSNIKRICKRQELEEKAKDQYFDAIHNHMSRNNGFLASTYLIKSTK